MLLRGGRYETIEKIAVGGMAKVLLGRTVGVGGFERLVAIKSMHEHLSSEPEFVAMFLDEARLAARIHHPNVVSTLDVDEDEEGIFIVMEYVDGPALSAVQRALRKDFRMLPTGVMLRIFLDALAGLHAAHELKGSDGELLQLVHRDVSPANILIGLDGITRLTDFGVARAESRLSTTTAGQIKGKLAFMAPEQLDNLPLDRRADVYSAGVVLWELCTGQRMLTAESEGGLIREVLRGRRRSPGEVVPGLPSALESACMRALEPAPADRFPTAAAFAEAIESADVPVASARAVSAFLTELGIRPQQHHSLPPSSVRGSSRPGSRVGEVSRAEAAQDAAVREAAPIPSTQPTATSTSFTMAGRRRGRGALTVGLSLAALAAAALWAAPRLGTRRPAGVVAAASPSVSASAAPAPPAPPAPTAPPATAIADDAGASTAETGASSAPVASSPLVHTGGPLRREGGARARPASAPTSPTSFRPAEL